MDHESLIAGLLHDTVEDTENVKFEEIEVSMQAMLNFHRIAYALFAVLRLLALGFFGVYLMSGNCWVSLWFVFFKTVVEQCCLDLSGGESLTIVSWCTQFYFGKAVRQIVEGETRFSKIGAFENASRAELAALDLKQLFLAMTEEVRIIIVKLADRLHNMRTLDSMPPHKQKKIAEETLLVRDVRLLF